MHHAVWTGKNLTITQIRSYFTYHLKSTMLYNFFFNISQGLLGNLVMWFKQP